MNFRYVFSAPAMLRLNKSAWEDLYPEEWKKVKSAITDGVQKLQKDIKNKIKGISFSIDLLYNAYTESDMGKRFSENNNFGFEKIYADSGGLQIVTARKEIDDKLKFQIYQNQSFADFAMCFDEIPVRNIEGLIINTKSNRSATDNKNYLPEIEEKCALKTARNIREQIEVFEKLNSSTKVYYIIQGNTYDDMVRWFQNGTKVLENHHYDKIAGLSLADTCMGNGYLESVDMLVAYYKIRKEFDENLVKNHIHLLGIGSVKRLVPVFYLMKSGFLPSNLTISFDSTSFSMSYFMGRFIDSKGNKIDSGSSPLKYKEMFHDVWMYFKDIYEKYFPECRKDDIINYTINNIRSLADTINNSDRINQSIIRTNITLTICWQILGFVKKIEDIIKYSYYDKTPLGLLQEVKDLDDYKRWNQENHHKVNSKRIKRKQSNIIDNWFA